MKKSLTAVFFCVSFLAGCANSAGDQNQPRDVKVTVYRNALGTALVSRDVLGRDLVSSETLNKARSGQAIGHKTLTLTDGRSSPLSLSNKQQLTLMLLGSDTDQLVQIQLSELTDKPATLTSGYNTLALPAGTVTDSSISRTIYKKGESMVFSTPDEIYVLTPEFN